MALNKQVVEEKYANDDITKESEALKRATNSLGIEEGTALYNKAKAETIANTIISNKAYIYKTSTEKYDKAINSLATKGLTLSNEYQDKKISIQNNGDLTEEGKSKQLKELYNSYNTQVKKVIREQNEVIKEYNANRNKIAAETLELIQRETSINDFTDKDITYITFMVQHGDNEQLLALLEEYNFSPFLINIINARDAKQSNYKNGKLNTEKLKVLHPLAFIQERHTFINQNELFTNMGTRQLYELVPIKGIPGIDAWA